MVINRNGNVDWQTLTIVCGAGVAVAGFAIWLGALSRQLDINTARLDRIQEQMVQVLTHDADTLAREAAIDKRLDRIERNDK